MKSTVQTSSNAAFLEDVEYIEKAIDGMNGAVADIEKVLLLNLSSSISAEEEKIQVNFQNICKEANALGNIICSKLFD
jgi:hypothetical protein